VLSLLLDVHVHRHKVCWQGSPSRVKVEEASVKGTSALPAMGSLQDCGGEESKRIKDGGQGERRKRGGHFKAKRG